MTWIRHRLYTVCIPSESPNKLPRVARIGGCKVVENPSAERPLEEGDTVLMVLGADGSVEVDGFADWSVYPDRKWTFEDDRFMYDAFYLDGDYRKANWRRVAERVKIAGGALPVTVEYAHNQPKGGGKAIFFSTRNQELTVEKGQTARATVRGQLPGSGWIVVQVGGRLGALRPGDLIMGLPERLREKAVAILRDHKIPIWLHGGSRGLHYGVPSPERKELTVHPQFILEIDEDGIEGIVCAGSIDQRLRWLPAECAAATPLSPEFAASAFTNSKAALQVLQRADGSISVLDHPKVRRELTTLTIGSQMSVQRITQKNAENSLWSNFNKDGLGIRLVRSRATGLVLTAAVQGKGPHYKVEVAERRESVRSCYVLAIQSGHRQAWTDFPVLLDNAEPVDGATARNPFCVLFERDPDYWQRTKDIKDAFAAMMEEGSKQIAAADLSRYAAAYRSTDVVSLLGGIGAAFLMIRCVPTGDDQSLPLLRDISTRALRSIHLELLGRLMQERSKGQSHEAASVARRIDALLAKVRQQRQGLATVQAGLERLYDDLTLNGRLDYDWSIVDALAVSLGQPAYLGRLLSDESKFSYTADTIRALRLLVLLEMPTPSQISEAVERLALVGQRMLQNETDVPMTRALSSAH